MAGINGNHPDVDHAMRTAHHGRGAAHSTAHGLRTSTFGKGNKVIDREDLRDQGRDETAEQNARGPKMHQGQKGHPLTD